MNNDHPYTYRVFSRRIGNISELESHIDIITDFSNKFLGTEAISLFQDKLKKINLCHIRQERFSGAIFAFDGQKVIGYMDFLKMKWHDRIFETNFAFVEKQYRRQGVWTCMSILLEEEVKKMGGEGLHRVVDKELIIPLKKEGYEVTDYYPNLLTKRL